MATEFADTYRSRLFTQQQIARFWSHVDIREVDDCWVWTGATREGRYGFFGVKGKTLAAHRFVWALTHDQPIPHGMLVCHNCPDGDNPLCVNPSHLFLGTPLENMRDMVAKGRHGLARNPQRAARGERAGNARLTEEDVIAIRQEYSGGKTHLEIASTFGVNEGTIRHIVMGHTWRHVVGPQEPAPYRTGKKLTPIDIPAIRAAHATGETFASIGRRYHVTGQQIRCIVQGMSWSHIQ